MLDGFFQNFRFRVRTSFSSFFRTRPDSQKLVPTLIFAKKREKIAKNTKNESELAVFRKFGLERVFRAFSELVLTRPDSFRLETRLESSVKSSESRALFFRPRNLHQFYDEMFTYIFLLNLHLMIHLWANSLKFMRPNLSWFYFHALISRIRFYQTKLESKRYFYFLFCPTLVDCNS